MKRKVLHLLMGITVTAALAGGTGMAAFAAEDAAAETEITTEAEAPEEDAETTEAETEATEADTGEAEADEDEFVEGSAVLSDYNYEAGEMTEDGWESKFLGMKYAPADESIKMGIEENEKLATYYTRHGEDKQVANNEMVATDENDGYVQLMAEVNPNGESAEDILSRFAEMEELELVSETDTLEVAGKEFLICTGVVDKDRYLVGVCTDEDDIVLALKVKYQNTSKRRALMNGFDVIEEADADEAETEAADEEEVTEAESDVQDADLSMPDEFEDAELITEAPEAAEDAEA